MKRFYTTIEQSKKLLKLGLSPDTADMEWIGEHWCDEETGKIVNGWSPVPVCKIEIEEEDGLTPVTLPCWSLQALLEIASKEHLHKISLLHRGYEGNEYEADWWCHFEDRKETFGDMETKTASTPIDAVYAMVCWLLEKGHIKKGSL